MRNFSIKKNFSEGWKLSLFLYSWKFSKTLNIYSAQFSFWQSFPVNYEYFFCISVEIVDLKRRLKLNHHFYMMGDRYNNCTISLKRLQLFKHSIKFNMSFFKDRETLSFFRSDWSQILFASNFFVLNNDSSFGCLLSLSEQNILAKLWLKVKMINV